MCKKDELIEGENARKCNKCGKLKGFNKFWKDRSGKYGIESKCAKCRIYARKNRKPVPEPKLEITILPQVDNNCPILIESHNSRVCTGCDKLKGFGQFHKNKRFKYGISCRCKDCEASRKKVKGAKEYRRWDEDSVIEERNKWNTIDELQKNGGGAYGWIHDNVRHDLLDPLRQIPQWTLEKVKLETLKYSTRYAFFLGSGSAYNWARTNKVLNMVCGHMSDARMGFSRTGFIEKCKEKSDSGETDGPGLLYMIVCWNSEELFYKIGITSRTVKQRYCNNRDMPYNYRIVWEIRDDPGKIWDMEKQCHRETKDRRYQPELWNSKSMETFTI